MLMTIQLTTAVYSQALGGWQAQNKYQAQGLAVSWIPVYIRAYFAQSRCPVMGNHQNSSTLYQLIPNPDSDEKGYFSRRRNIAFLETDYPGAVLFC